MCSWQGGSLLLYPLSHHAGNGLLLSHPHHNSSICTHQMRHVGSIQLTTALSVACALWPGSLWTDKPQHIQMRLSHQDIFNRLAFATPRSCLLKCLHGICILTAEESMISVSMPGGVSKPSQHACSYIGRLHLTASECQMASLFTPRYANDVASTAQACQSGTNLNLLIPTSTRGQMPENLELN